MATFMVEGSSNIRSINTDRADDGSIVVEFVTGTKYSYAGLDKQTITDFLQAESKGGYFAANIKGKYDSIKL